MANELPDHKRVDGSPASDAHRNHFLFGQNPVPMFVYETNDLKILAVNDPFVAKYGYSREEAVKLRLTDLHPEQQRGTVAETVRTLGEGEHNGEWWHRSKAGTEIAVLVSSRGIDYDGRPARIVVAIDITERKRAEESLKQSEETLRQAEAIGHMGSLDWDLTTNRIALSDEAYRLHGISQGEELLTPELVTRSVHPDDLSFVGRALELAVRGERPYDIDHRILLPDGTVRWVHAHARLLKDSEGEAKRLLRTVVDITERQQAMNALHEREERYQKLIDLLPDALLVNVNGRIVLANPACCRLLGAADPSELIGKSVSDIMHPDYQDSVRERQRAALEGGTAPLREEKCLRLDGSVVDVDAAAVGIEWRGSRGSQVIIRDITERKQAERELRESQERYRRLFEDHSAAKLVIDIETTAILDANEAAARFYGWPREQLKTMTLQDMNVLPSEQLRTMIARTASKGENHVELRHRRADGSTRDVEVFTSVIRIDEKRVFESIIHDISDRKRAEAALRESEERYRRLIMFLSDPISIQVDGRIAFANEAMCRLLGADNPSVLQGRPVFEIVHPDSHEVVRHRLSLLAEGRPVPTADEKFIRLDGTSVDVEVSGVALEWQGASGVQIMARDVTGRRAAEAEIRRLNRIYTVLSGINKAIVRIGDPLKLFTEICRIAVEDGGFVMAWFGALNTKTQKVDVLTSFGRVDGYLRTINIDLKDERRNKSPAARAVTFGSHVVSNDLQHDETMLPWREQVARRGYRSGAVFPIMVSGKVWGSFSMYSDETDFFSADEVRLLDELAMDISFAIGAIEEESERKKAEEALRKSEDRLKSSLSEIRNLNRTFTVLSNVNQAIVRIHDAELLFRETCRIAVDDGGFVMAWLGILMPDSNKVEVLSSSGDVGDYLRNINIDLSDENARKGPTARAVLSGTHVVSSDIEHDDNMLPWRSSAREMGYRSSAAFPIMVSGKVWGVFNLYSPEANFFGADETKLLNELALDISFAIEFMTKEAARRDAEESLRRSEELLRSSLRVANIGVYERDHLNHTVYSSPRQRELHGLTPDEPVTFETFLRQIHPEDVERVASKIRESHDPSGDGLWNAQYRIVRPDGSVRWLLGFAETLFDGHGSERHPVRTVGAILDITDQKQAEQQLQLSGQIINRVNSLILIADATGLITYASPSVKPILGYEPEEIRGDGWWRLARWGAKEGHNQESAAAVARGDLPLHESAYEAEAHAKDGTVHWILWQEAKGPNRELIGVGQDITERKQAEEALTLSERKYRDIVESAPLGIYRTTPDGRFTTCNHEMARILGYDSPDQMVGLDMADGIHIDRELRSSLAERVDAQGYVFGEEIAWKKRNGTPVWVQVDARSIKDDDGLTLRFEGFVRDITERKLAEEQLRQNEARRRELERGLIQAQKLESLGTLASGVAHDFNNLLGVIIGHASLLQNHLRGASAVVQKGLDAILAASTRGAGLVKQMLTFARKTDVSTQPVLLNDIVNEVVRFIRETFPKTITVEINLDPDLPSIDADATQVHQVLLNLCVNARDAMTDGGILTIATSTRDGARLLDRLPAATSDNYVALRVEDTGTGMDEETQRRIFEPFFTTKEHGTGTGLGLSLVFGIMQSHDGFVTLHSEPNQGTTFECFFPIPTRREEDAPTPATEGSKSPPSGNETLLVVEDEESLRELLGQILVSKGYSVLLAENGEQGLAIYQERRNEIDLVLSDLGLPKFGGDELYRRLKEIDSGVRLILASGFVEPGMKTTLLQEGVKEVIPKPYSLVEVLHTVRRVLDEG